jgi:hypothetical protein
LNAADAQIGRADSRQLLKFLKRAFPYLLEILVVILIFAAAVGLLWLLIIRVAKGAEYDILPAQREASTARVVPPDASTWEAYPLLKRIASCESWGDPSKEPRQFLPNGSVLRGYPNPNDIGLAQINIPTWGAPAAELGFDLKTYEGNLAMAKWIFDRYGSAPWRYSQKCWGRYD